MRSRALVTLAALLALHASGCQCPCCCGGSAPPRDALKSTAGRPDGTESGSPPVVLPPAGSPAPVANPKPTTPTGAYGGTN